MMRKGKRQFSKALFPRALQEKHYLQQIIDYSRLYGWLHFHQYDSRMSEPGWPDLALLHPIKRRFLIREIKVENEPLSAEQVVWLEGLIACGCDAGVWRLPQDWDEIEATLSR